MRHIQSLKIFEQKGILVLVLFSMLTTDLVNWFTITLIFTAGFGVAFTVLQGGKVLENPLAVPFFEPFWGLLGDFDLDGAYEFTGPCAQRESNTQPPAPARPAC